MKNILIISYFTPPLNLAPAIRIGKFAKHLPRFGWNPIILTVKEIDFYQKDEELWKDVPNLNIVRTASFDFFQVIRILKKNKNIISKQLFKEKENFIYFIKKLFPIDDKIGWLPFCYSAGKKIIKEKKIDAIFTTLGGVYHPAITAYLLAKKYDIPLILEFRDLWADNPLHEITFYNQKLNNYFEAKTLNFANKVITLAPGAKSLLEDKYKFNKNKIEIIRSGFDKEDFKRGFPSKTEKDTLIITFCGSFYTKLSPADLFNSVLIIEERLIRIKIRFIGNFRKNFWDLKEKFEKRFTDKNVLIKVIPRMHYSKLLDELHKSDVLVLFLPNDKKSKVILHAKLFDYLPIKKPILAFCPKDSDVEHIIKTGNLGFAVESGNIEEGKKQIEKIIELFKKNKLKTVHGNDDFINQFDRKKLTKKLSNLLDSTLT